MRNGARIVDDISFSIEAGETFALLGESGCGKSMTALSLMRLLPDGVTHAGGAAQLDGMALFGLPEREMRAVRGGTDGDDLPGTGAEPESGDDGRRSRSPKYWRCIRVCTARLHGCVASNC